MSISSAIKRIEPDRNYNLSNIRDEQLFPWARDIRTVRKIVLRDDSGERMLKVKITGEGRTLDYKIKGKNIIQFLNKYGPGFALSATPK